MLFLDPSSIILDPKTSVIINGDVVIGEHRIINLPSFNMGGGGVTDEYLVVCKQAPSGGGVDASGIQGRISFSRGSDGSFNNSHYMDINIQMSLDSGSVNTLDVTQFELYRDSTNPFFSQLEEIDIDGTKYVALKARSSGGGSDNHNYFEGSISDALDTNILSRVRASDSTVTVTAPQPTGFPITPYITKNQDGNVGIGTTSPSHTLDVNGELRVGTVVPQTPADFSVRRNGANIEFGHGNRTSGYYGTIGVQGNNGMPYIALSADCESSVNTFTTRGFKGNVITTDGAGSLMFSQLTTANATGQSLTERMRIDASGNVGIGTTSVPSEANLSLAAKTTTEGGHLVINKATSSTHATHIDNNTDTFRIMRGTNSASGSVQFILNHTNGNVGIGTTSPSQKLHITEATSNSYASLRLQGSNRGGIIEMYQGAYPVSSIQTDQSGNTYISTSGAFGSATLSPKISIATAGNVGIGTTAPAQKLDVVGKMKISDDIILAQTNGRIDYDNGVSSGALRFFSTSGNTERMRIASSGNVGIGTTSPGTKLHVGTGSGATVDTGYQMVIDSAGIAGLQILSATNQSGRIVFGDSGDNDIGMIKYDHTDNSMGFRTNGSGNERMRINSSGNVGIGTTSPQSKLQVAGGIQMADDTAAASADKAGTMRYRTGTEYVEVNGTELVTNGDFAGGSQDWTKEAGWSIASSKASYDASSATNALYQSAGLTTGSVYKLSFTVIDYTSGSFKGHLSNGNATAATDAISANGDYSFNITATGALVLFRNVTSFNGSIDNVSVIEVTAEDASYADMCMQTGSSTYEWVNIVRNTY